MSNSLSKTEKQRIGRLCSELVSFISANIPVKQINETSAHLKMQQTGFYPIRIAPTSNCDLLSTTRDLIQSDLAATSGIKFCSVYAKMHSSKFSSVLLEYCGANFGLVIAAGANKGESFELELFNSMNACLKGEHNLLGESAFKALQKADSTILLPSIVSIDRRTGSTRRSSKLSSAEIIADIVISMQNDKKFISVKDENGYTVANFGISKAFNEDLSVNTDSAEWIEWIAPFMVEPELVTNGLREYKHRIPTEDRDEHLIDVRTSEACQLAIRKLFGSDYIYLRKTRTGFDSVIIDERFLSSLLEDMVIKSVTYPSIRRKQINIKCESEKCLIKLEIRNPSGQIKPKDLKMKMFKK
jgi:hypothetical protein